MNRLLFIAAAFFAISTSAGAQAVSGQGDDMFATKTLANSEAEAKILRVIDDLTELNHKVSNKNKQLQEANAALTSENSILKQQVAYF